jgi:hypothetical protein
LTPVHPDELQDVWDLIWPGLKKVERHSASHWIPEDVYHAIKSGASVLHLCYVDGDYCGFTVSNLVQNFDGKVLHFWIVYNDSKVDIIKTFMPDVESMAHRAGAKRITFWSPRKWERRIKAYGFVPAQTEFVKEL